MFWYHCSLWTGSLFGEKIVPYLTWLKACSQASITETTWLRSAGSLDFRSLPEATNQWITKTLVNKPRQELQGDLWTKVSSNINRLCTVPPPLINNTTTYEKLTSDNGKRRKLWNADLPFTKSFEKIRLESKWKTTFWVVPVENFPPCQPWKGSPVLVPGRNVPNEKFVFHFFKPSLIPHSGLRSCFPIKGNELYKKVNAAIPRRNLPVLNFYLFAFHFPKPSTDWLSHENGKQPVLRTVDSFKERLKNVIFNSVKIR